MEKEFADPISHFREVARKMTEAENNTKHLQLNIDMDERLSEENKVIKNLGYAVPLSVYYDLG
ncbi:MAG: transposase, partial [Clostridiaceae bacterium]|nr:transposase [Clostridiaceae bacterium]